MSNVFSSKFVNSVRDFLKTACADAKNTSREAVVAYLATVGINATPELVGLAVASGAIDSNKAAYGLFRGRSGGIREVDLDATQAELAKVEAARQVEDVRQASIAARIAKAQQTKAAKKAAQASASV